MEEALLALENKRKDQKVQCFHNATRKNNDDISKACKSLAKALHDYCRILSKNVNDVAVGGITTPPPSSTATTTTSSKDETYSSTTSWLYNLCQTIPSPLDTKALSSAILSACQKDDEMQIQASLFYT